MNSSKTIKGNKLFEELFEELYKKFYENQPNKETIDKIVKKYCNKTYFTYSFFIFKGDFEINNANAHVLAPTKVILEEEEIHRYIAEIKKLKEKSWLIRHSGSLEGVVNINLRRLNKSGKKLKSAIPLYKKIAKGKYVNFYHYVELATDEETAQENAYREMFQYNKKHLNEAILNVQTHLKAIGLKGIDSKQVQEKMLKEMIEDLNKPSATKD